MMDAAEFVVGLEATTVRFTLGVVLALALRLPARRIFGARVAMNVWWLVPAALAAVVLPEPVSKMAALTEVGRVVKGTVVAPTPSGDWGIATLLVLTWLAGAAVCAMRLLWLQRRFISLMGSLRGNGRIVVAERSVPGLPATIGLLRSRIVVPPDFQRVYPRRERALIVMHERAHIAAADVQTRACAALLQCLFWFHPIAHLAVRALRRDQELACDARVIAATPCSRRQYAEALLAMQLTHQGLPVGCHWANTHPLKERIIMLKKQQPSNARRRAGIALVGVFVALAGVSATVLQAAPALLTVGELHVVARIDDGQPRDWRGPIDAGVAHRYDWPTDDGHHWTMSLTAQPIDGGKYQLDATVARDGQLVSKPKLIVRDTQPAGVALGTESDGRFHGLRLDITASSPSADKK